MSRRYGRESESKRHRSRFFREPSPKRYRREDDRKNVKTPSKTHFDKDEDENRKLRRSLQDPLHIESPLPSIPDTENRAVVKEAEKNDDQDLAKQTSDLSKLERSRSYFQHDDRDALVQSGRSIRPRPDRDFGSLRYSKEHPNDRTETYSRRRNEIYEPKKRDDGVWRHDGYFELETNPKPIVSKRPSFREQKIQQEPKILTDKIGSDPLARNPQDRSFEARRNDQRWHSSDRSFRPERSFSRDTELSRKGDRHIGKERLPPRQGYRQTGSFFEKWKHDLYDESIKSPSPKNEEDQISKIEALLAS